MNRFKSRVWSIEENCYVDKAFAIACTSGELISLLVHMKYDYSKFIIEQCTGLKDRNGKLIFEGDVFIYLDDKRKRLVKWDDRNFMFEVTFLDCGNDGSFPYYTESSIIEIIENIHEVKND